MKLFFSSASYLGGDGERSRPHDFPGVHKIVRIERQLNHSHNANSVAVLGNEKIHFAVTDPVLASARTFHCQCPCHHSVVKSAGFSDFFRSIRVNHKDEMEIAISYVAHHS